MSEHAMAMPKMPSMSAAAATWVAIGLSAAVSLAALFAGMSQRDVKLALTDQATSAIREEIKEQGQLLLGVVSKHDARLAAVEQQVPKVGVLENRIEAQSVRMTGQDAQLASLTQLANRTDERLVNLREAVDENSVSNRELMKTCASLLEAVSTLKAELVELRRRSPASMGMVP